MTFCVGDIVRMLDANAIESEAGRNLRSQCIWMHDRVSEHAGEVGVIREFSESSFTSNGVTRDCFCIITDDGNEYWCHPEWMELVEDVMEPSEELDRMFSEL